MCSRIVIPGNLHFDDLKLKLEASGQFSFDATVLQTIYAASQLEPSPAVTEAIIMMWYFQHIARGGQRNLICEMWLERMRNSAPADDYHPRQPSAAIL
jgi:hypothetical protein